MAGDEKTMILINPKDWEKSLQYDITEPQAGLWCHFLTDTERLFYSFMN